MASIGQRLDVVRPDVVRGYPILRDIQSQRVLRFVDGKVVIDGLSLARSAFSGAAGRGRISAACSMSRSRVRSGARNRFAD